MMSSSPSTPSRSAPTTTASKRLSLNVSAGPRPLHLVDGNVPSTPGPATAPLPTTFYPTTPELSSPTSSSVVLNRPLPRRQSSISYRSADRNADRDATVRSPPGSARHSLNRSFSLGPKSSSSFSSSRDRRSVGIEGNGMQERPPLTLAENHSELLHVIAQKESKCLELRSQLATHEAELLQLKRKWERIVSRGFEKAGLDGMTSPNGQGSGAVLEGIREGVQGVSRFLAAGLSIGELSPHPLPPPPRPTHSNSQSNSSVSTYATKSTRFSQSSASSLGEEPLPPASSSEQAGGDDTVQILMVHDTGATPTMSPNPAFMHQQQLREEQRRTDSAPHSARSSFDTTQESFMSGSTIQSAKMHRRKSRDSHQFDILLSPNSPMAPPQPPSPSKSSEKLEAAKAKRASLNGTAFPPVSSIPGLASLTVGASSVPVSSWVGSVGKKWEELQRGSTFTKSQKRASILLSDVSHSIVSALSPPPLSSSASSKSSSPIPPSYFSPLPSSSMTASTTSTSLLDDDDTGDLMSSSVMTPDTKPKPKSRPKPDPIIQSQRRLSASKAKAKVPARTGDDEEEWNWQFY
ncbi:hypothetical protein Hypma_003433 [Hypsizygus marmoreus]|uniref:Uncharacterized protein n=1 Tax=Hypsizygus marmoreus TaxID=39966 RepID=A0A369J664_HYPMA|nr:hypothetical protein Hypma_003433 [Hypsizygus marmoreus]